MSSLTSCGAAGAAPPASAAEQVLVLVARRALDPEAAPEMLRALAQVCRASRDAVDDPALRDRGLAATLGRCRSVARRSAVLRAALQDPLWRRAVPRLRELGPQPRLEPNALGALLAAGGTGLRRLDLDLGLYALRGHGTHVAGCLRPADVAALPRLGALTALRLRGADLGPSAALAGGVGRRPTANVALLDALWRHVGSLTALRSLTVAVGVGGAPALGGATGLTCLRLVVGRGGGDFVGELMACAPLARLARLELLCSGISATLEGPGTRALAQLTGLTALVLGRGVWTPSLADTGVAQALGALRRLQRLEVATLGLLRPADADVLAPLTALTAVRFSGRGDGAVPAVLRPWADGGAARAPLVHLEANPLTLSCSLGAAGGAALTALGSLRLTQSTALPVGVLEALAPLTGLRHLALAETTGAPLRPEHGAALAALTGLRALSVGFATVAMGAWEAQAAAAAPAAAVGLGWLAGLRGLTALALQRVPAAEGAGLGVLTGLAELRDLRLALVGGGTAHGAAVAAAVGALTGLTRLDLGGSPQLGVGALATLGQLPGLQALSLRGCRGMGAAALMPLGAATHLVELDVLGTPLCAAPALVAAARALPRLRWVIGHAGEALEGAAAGGAQRIEWLAAADVPEVAAWPDA